MKILRRIPRWILLQVLMLLFVTSEAVFAGGRISGIVYDAKTGRPLSGANVILIGTHLGTATEKTGRFTILEIPEGVYTIEISFIGYQIQRKEGVSVENNAFVFMVFRMIEKPIELKAISVTPSHFSIGRETSISRRTLTRDEMKSITPLGEDIYRAVTRLPGVVGNDFSSKFAVRGGRPEETLVLFDGLELYEPFHLKDIAGGIISIIDMEAIGSIDLMTGGFTADYGNKMSGVFNIQSTRMPARKRRISLGLSLMNARFFTENRFHEERGLWMLSARRGYYDLLMRLMGEEDEILPEYYDIFGKVRYQVSRSHSISAQFLAANDGFKFEDHYGNTADTKYGNAYVWVTVQSFWNAKLSTQSIVSLGQVGQKRNARIYDDDRTIRKKAFDERDFRFLGFKQDWMFELAEELLLKGGIDAKRLSADYDYFKSNRYTVGLITGETKTIVDTLQSMIHPSGLEFGGYLSGRVRVFSLIAAEIGLRYDFHSYPDDRTWSPRVNLAFTPGSQSALKFGWGRFYQSQGIHELEIPDGKEVFSPTELAEHRVLGMEHVFWNGIELRLEAYQKKLTHLRPRYINLIGTLDIFPELSGDRTREVPDWGEARGIEIYLHQNVGEKYSWWAGYCLTSAKDWIAGRYVPRQYDQRHTIDLNFNYKPSTRWRFNVSWQFHSGWPYTDMYLRIRETEGRGLQTILTPNKLREDRLPAYHRLDLRLSRYFELSKGRLSVVLELINAYSRANVKTFDYQIVDPNSEDAKLERIEYHWLPILPSVGISWEM